MAVLAFGMLLLAAVAGSPPPDAAGAANPLVASTWKGRRVAFLGDSLTDKKHCGFARFTADWGSRPADDAYGRNAPMEKRS